MKTLRKFFSSAALCLILLSLSESVSASDWIGLSVLTDRIIVLHFDDGYVQHNGYRQPSTATVVIGSPLNVGKAALAASYQITSPDDDAFRQVIVPVKVGRKSKVKDVSNNCRWINSVCDNEFVSEHFLYLSLPHALQPGKTYIISVGDLAENYQTDTLRYNPLTTRSEAIHANQLGFKPSAPVKYAYLSHWMGDGGPLSLNDYRDASFYLVETRSGRIAYQGRIRQRLNLATSNAFELPIRYPEQRFLSMSDVWECDFSDFKEPGEYRVVVEGMGCSFPFMLNEDIYREAYYHATRQLYHQRSGIPLEQPYTEWTRPRNLHPADGQIRFQYTTSRWIDWPANASENGVRSEVYARVLPDFNISTWGWYMDAGDWDGYYSHLQIPRFLMLTFDMAPDRFTDGELNIPESGNGIPDILDEARFLIDYLDRTRGPLGGIAGARVHPDFETKTSDFIPSWEDVRVWTISGEDHVTTYTFAGLAAYMAHCYTVLGLQDSATLMRQKALAAYDWAGKNHPQGEDARNARMYAAAALFRLTGEKAYEQQFATDFDQPSQARWAPENQRLAAMTYLLCPTDQTDDAVRTRVLNWTVQWVVSEFVQTAEDRSFRVGFGPNFRVFLGQATTPLVFPALVLHHVTGEERYYRAALTSADYVLGGNPLDMTWMVGLGHRSPSQILHLDTWYHPDGRELFIPGTIPYGPTGPGDGWPPNNGPWSSDFAWDRSYPATVQWPLHEGFFNNRYAVPTNEYTVHQTSAPAAAVYGLLSDRPTGTFKPNQAPKVELTAPATWEAGSDVLLRVNATDADGYVLKVEYYHGRQKIGQSEEAPFSFTWRNAAAKKADIRAVATDNRGMRSGQSGGFVSIPLEGVTLANEQVEVQEGGQTVIAVRSFTPANATLRHLVWTSQNPDIATVDQTGRIRGVKAGQTTVSVRGMSHPEVTAAVRVTVTPVVLSLEDLPDTIGYYPNPVLQGELMLQLPESIPSAQVEVLTLNGVRVLSTSISGNSSPHRLDMRHLPKGLYLLQLSHQERVFRYKVVKQ